jgi:FixJ family two-component response regulator
MGSVLASKIRDRQIKQIQTVILIDDDTSVLRALRRLLLAADFKVLAFNSAEAFLATQIPARNVCLLLDIYLPGMNGIDLCGTLAASGRSLPTILMTANDDEATQKIARNAGVLATLYKPFDADVLLATIARALAGSQVKPRNQV